MSSWFQSTLPRGERRPATPMPWPRARFNPRSREGSDTRSRPHIRPRRAFQSTLPRGERLAGAKRVFEAIAFQSTLPRGERPPSATSITRPNMFQSTLPRGERPAADMPVGSASVFQSTLPRGERPDLLLGEVLGGGFQSTLPRGERPRARTRSADPRAVSIHAPARGATLRLSSITSPRKLFQSTLPRGERPAYHCRNERIIVSFNPRSREGSDARRPGSGSRCRVVSIHAPARGATPVPVIIVVLIVRFQSTLPRGERRRRGDSGGGGEGVSIHAPARGATRKRAAPGGGV